MPVGEEGFLPGAALPGSLESFVGREAILQRYRREGGVPDLPSLLRALERGEGAALATLAAWSHYLGRGLASITALLDPCEIILAGPVSALFVRGEATVRQALARHLLPGQPLPRLSASQLGPDGAALGSARLLQHRLLAVDEDFVLGRKEPS
jgi:predicted NBD/HSP70 family sugar kinase